MLYPLICKRNVSDSKQKLDIIKKIGYEKTERDEYTNINKLKKGHIKDKAKEKVNKEMERLKKIFK